MPDVVNLGVLPNKRSNPYGDAIMYGADKWADAKMKLAELHNQLTIAKIKGAEAEEIAKMKTDAMRDIADATNTSKRDIADMYDKVRLQMSENKASTALGVADINAQSRQGVASTNANARVETTGMRDQTMIDRTNMQDQTKVATTGMNNQASLSKALMEMKVKTADLQRKKDQEDFKHTETTLKQLAYMKEVKPMDYVKFMMSDHGKELLKHVNDIMPDRINDDQKDPSEKINLSGYFIKDQSKDRLNKIVADYAEAVRSGKPVDPHLEQAAKAIQMHGADEISRLTADGLKSGKVPPGDQKALSEYVKSGLAVSAQARNQQQQGNAPGDELGIKNLLQPQYAKALSQPSSGDSDANSNQY